MINQVKQRFQNFFSRSAVRARNNLGIVLGDERTGVNKCRNKTLETFDAYYDGTQYDNMPPWDDAHSKDGEFIPVRKRQPRIKFNLAKVLVDRVASKLVGQDAFPDFKVEDDPDDSSYINSVIKASKMKSRVMETIKLMGLSGSALYRFYLVDGTLMGETFHSKWCYPVFKPSGKLESVKVMYTYYDENDKDAAGNPKEKWYRLDLTETADILYDNPQYNYEALPKFSVVSVAQHELGFVQGVWFRTSVDKFSPDGTSLVADVLDFIDEMNYSMSQSSQAIGYGQEPQLTLTGMEESEIERLIKSSSKAWNLGAQGKAEFLDPKLEGVKQAIELRDKVRMAIQDVSRVIMHDPDKMVAHAQSGRALEVLHAPFIELINELRPMVEECLEELITKQSVAVLVFSSRGFQTDIEIPAGYMPQSLSMTVTWPPVFPMTLDDLNTKVGIGAKAAATRIMSEETITRWLGPDFNVENIDDELARIKAQPMPDPFGGGGFLGGGQQEG